MSNEIILGLGIGIVVASLIIVYLRRPTRGVTVRTAESVLDEVEIMIAYGQEKDAVDLLKQTKLEFPDNKILNEKLAEMEQYERGSID